MADITKDMEGLPLGLLIAQPIIEVAKGQTELCKVYLDSLFKLAFVNGKDGEARTINFKLKRPVVGANGESKMMDCEVQAPLLALVPLPAFTMDEATVKFSMELKSQDITKTNDSAESSFAAGFSNWGFSAQINGKVSAARENTRTTDKSAKYEIFARAVQQQPVEGMAKLSSIFASVIEPVTVGGGK